MTSVQLLLETLGLVFLDKIISTLHKDLIKSLVPCTDIQDLKLALKANFICQFLKIFEIGVDEAGAVKSHNSLARQNDKLFYCKFSC